jgi:hypothetical protein
LCAPVCASDGITLGASMSARARLGARRQKDRGEVAVGDAAFQTVKLTVE